MMAWRTTSSLHGFRGFSLSELLVVMLVLSIISTISMLKVWHANTQRETYNVLKETVSTMAQLLQFDARQERLTTAAAMNAWLESKLNVQQYCNSNATSQGCIGKARINSLPGAFWQTAPAFVFANGCIVFLNLVPFPGNGMETTIMYRGNSLWIAWNPTTTSVTHGTAGTLTPGAMWSGANNAWINWLFEYRN
jgi:prepilin-type N-terminal cleavage/methylation domain-containing protein